MDQPTIISLSTQVILSWTVKIYCNHNIPHIYFNVIEHYASKNNKISKYAHDMKNNAKFSSTAPFPVSKYP